MVKLFTHTDLDGIGCAILAKLAFNSAVDITYCNYSEVNDKIEEFFENDSKSICNITDISINDELAKKINDSSKIYYLIDHHQTAMYLNKYDWCKVVIEDKKTNIKTSATELYYHWLIEAKCLQRTDTLDRFVEIIRNYDTWRWDELGDEGTICKQVNDLLYIYGKEKFINWCISEIYNDSFPTLGKFENLVLNIRQKEINDYIEEKDKNMIISTICDRKCGIIFAERYFSELGNRLCTRHPEIDFIVMIDMNGFISYRTIREDINLGKDIARIFSGGGHPKAAGSQFTKEIQIKVIEEIFRK